MKLDAEVVASLERLGGDELVHRLFRTFLDHTPTRLGELRSAVADEDLESLTRAVHSLRSSSAMLGAMELSALAGELEALGDEGALQPLLGRVPELEASVREFVELLEERLAGSAG